MRNLFQLEASHAARYGLALLLVLAAAGVRMALAVGWIRTRPICLLQFRLPWRLYCGDAGRRWLAEASLQKAYAELTAIQANAPLLLLVIDNELRVETANDYAARFASRTFEEIQGQRGGGSIGCLNAPADPRGCGHGPGAVPAAFHRCDATRQSEKSTAMRQDITEWKRSELELARQSAAMRQQAQLTNLSHDAIVMLDAGRVITGWNASATEDV